MPKDYKHLAYEQRCQIHALLKRNTSKSQIASIVGVHRPTITREIRRNSGKRGYRFKQVQSKAAERRSKANMRLKKLTHEITLYVEEKLCKFQWNPEQITGRLKRKYGTKISHELIYRYIWSNKRAGGLLYKYLRRKSKKYNNRSAKKAGRAWAHFELLDGLLSNNNWLQYQKTYKSYISQSTPFISKFRHSHYCINFSHLNTVLIGV